jgi:hypothetical protein
LVRLNGVFERYAPLFATNHAALSGGCSGVDRGFLELVFGFSGASPAADFSGAAWFPPTSRI